MTRSSPILIVDDDPKIREVVRYALGREGFETLEAENGAEALEVFRRERPGLIILDILMPEMDGTEVCRSVREESRVPIIFLSSRDDEIDRILGLELGGDDYVTKPFSPRILVARVRAVLRRKLKDLPEEASILRIHDLVIHPGRHEVIYKGEAVQLTFTEFGILYHLAKRPGWVFTRFQIVDAVKGDDYPVTDRSVDVQIVGLRKKLGPAGQYIETVRGVGYRFKE